ncbi:AraC family transcriptional regulator [Nocardia altamirensis]|uniref:AraC family transcriptional regulator n=1 Tax=Nocardia altamirensis TaxID=472158 RepID=UPI00083FF18F|nr:helix-turn-helix transcriptional regulator [Nocardia altamirensis]
MDWSGSLAIEPGRLTYVGSLGDAHTHSHAAVQITAVLDGEVEFGDDAGELVHARAAIIPSGVSHHVQAGAVTGVMIYLDPTSPAARAAVARIDPIDRTSVTAWTIAAQNLPTGADLSPSTLLAALLGPAPGPTAPHPCVSAAITLIPAVLADGPVRVGDIAAEVGISADRLGRLFARDMGLSFPAYVRWARLLRAAEIARAGDTLTNAAHAAGFTDGAHLNRVVHEMFGLTPSHMIQSITLT